MVEILEFQGRLDHDDLFEWLHTVERVFEYKEILEDKKGKAHCL